VVETSYPPSLVYRVLWILRHLRLHLLLLPATGRKEVITEMVL
jgi:hypothetical protein